MTTPTTFRRIFGWMMAFVGVTWMWTVALILAWPPEKTNVWEPHFRLVATCVDKEACGVAFSQLATERAKGKLTALVPPEPNGEIGEIESWLKWKTTAGTPWTYEVTSSSWNFQTTVKYRVEGDKPVLVEVQRFDKTLFFYAIGLALFTLTGIYLRSLRKQ